MTTSSTEEAAIRFIETKQVQLFTPKVVCADIISAIVVASTAAVPIAIIDFAIMAKVSGAVPSMGHQVKAGFKQLFTKPAQFFLYDLPDSPIKYARVWQLVAGVYVGTYIVANVTRSFAEGYQQDHSIESVAFKCGVTSSAANIYLTIWKDTNILRVMPRKPEAVAAGAVIEKVFVPMLSRAGFAIRDAVTCIAAFTVVPLLKEHLYKTYPERFTEKQAGSAASLFTPCAIQIFTTNVHIPAIKYQNMYNPTRRWSGPEGYLQGIAAAIKVDYMGALRMRVMRICVAFGLGGIGNAELRPRLLKLFEPRVFQKKQVAAPVA